MRIGIFISDTGGRAHGHRRAARRRASGRRRPNLATAWVPHIPWSLDALTALALAGRATSRIELGTAVVPTYPRHPLALAQQALSTQAACGGRLLLGIGPSHPVVIESMHGLSYEKPVRHVREYLEVLDRAFAGPGQVHYEGETYSVNALLDVPDSSPVPVMLAALAPLMLNLAGSRTQGTITWMADERAHAEHILPKLTAAAADAGRPAPRVVAGLPARRVRRRRRRARAGGRASSPSTSRSRPTGASSTAARRGARPRSASSAPRQQVTKRLAVLPRRGRHRHRGGGVRASATTATRRGSAPATSSHRSRPSSEPPRITPDPSPRQRCATFGMTSSANSAT